MAKKLGVMIVVGIGYFSIAHAQVNDCPSPEILNRDLRSFRLIVDGTFTTGNKIVGYSIWSVKTLSYKKHDWRLRFSIFKKLPIPIPLTDKLLRSPLHAPTQKRVQDQIVCTYASTFSFQYGTDGYINTDAVAIT